MQNAPAVTLTESDTSIILHLKGPLTALSLAPVETYLFGQFGKSHHRRVVCDCEGVTDFDTSGALMLLAFRRQTESDGSSCEIEVPQEGYRRLLKLAETHRVEPVPREIERDGFFAFVGRWAVARVASFREILNFVGYAGTILYSYLYRLQTIRYKEIVFEINESAIKALGVVGLITFLVGVVIAYQSSIQLKLYGANIFIVDMLGIGIFRELAPLLVAVVVAGRSGSAYAAQIGVMKITEELDAMRTMGFDPYAFLVLPRLIALILMMPVLIFFADITGVLGGMIVSRIELGIGFDFFLERFSDVVNIRHFWVGIVKGPFFALLIASIGIYRGLQVKNDTQSIGFNTTRSVVESIFAVIICDAIFSIILTHLDI